MTSSVSPATRARTPRVYWRRRIVAAVVAIAFVGSAIYGATALTRPLPAAAATLTTSAPIASTAVPIAWPGFGGTGALGAEGFEGVLSGFGSGEQVPMASITKTVTALVVLQKHPLALEDVGPEIALTRADQSIYQSVIAEGGSAAPVAVGSVFTERQMLEAMMLPSANNYSISLANWAFGSLDNYLVAAKEWLATNGLTGTTVVDSAGLDERSAATPADLVEIGKLALANPLLADIVSMKSSNLPVIGQVSNTNQLLGTNGIIGLKTGTTDKAGACLLFAATVPVGSSTVTVVGVILGAPNHRVLSEGVLALLASVAPAFHQTTVIEKDEVLGTYSTPWGDTASAVAADSVTVVTWQDQPITTSVDAQQLTAAVSGSLVGTAVVTTPAQTVEIPLTLSGTLSDADPLWRLLNPTDP